MVVPLCPPPPQFGYDVDNPLLYPLLSFINTLYSLLSLDFVVLARACLSEKLLHFWCSVDRILLIVVEHSLNG